MMKTGRYRVRRGLFGKAILQAEYESPALAGGHVDASIRVLNWEDVDYDKAPPVFCDKKNPPKREGE